MTTALGIASVSVVLVDLLNNGLIDHDIGSTVGGRVTVSALPPDRVLSAGATETTQLNLFLHRVTPNIGWRNVGEPSRNVRGERISNPPLALNLHYLLSAYGEKDFYAEILLGFAMQLLHEHPVLTRGDIARALAPTTPEVPSSLPESLQDLSTSELADQAELVKLTPEPLSTEEISKIWTAFQSHYRATAAYEASVVLIHSRRSARPSLRVRERNVYVQPLQRPLIEAVASSSGDGEPILADGTIVVRGHRLAGELTTVRIGDQELTPAAGDVDDRQIAVALAGVALRAGLQQLRVVHGMAMGTPPVPHRGVESNPASFALVPAIVPPFAKSLVSGPPGLHGGTLSFGISPAIAPRQHAVLLLNQLLDLGAPHDAVAAGYSFTLAPVLTATTTAAFAVDGLAPGTYLARIQVDGVESSLAVDPVTGRFDAPKVVIP